MFQDIKKNKIKSGLIISIYIILITLIIYYICTYFELGPMSIVFATIFSCFSAFISYYNCDKIVLSMNKARPATEEEYSRINNILDSLMISSGLKSRPALYVMEDSQPNAFATGRNPEHSVICVTTSLLEKLDYYELEGVLAHELSHIANYDIRLSAIVTVFVGVIVVLSDMFTSRYVRPKSKSSDNDSNIGFLISILGFLFLILSPLFAQLVQLAVSRKREFLADATAIKYTRNPDGLISALIKISDDPDELNFASKATAHMFFASPFRGKESDLLSTHPSIEARIKALQNIK